MPSTSPSGAVSGANGPGTLIAGKYRLLQRIGGGAMGVVWAAKNEVTSGEVAIKLLAQADAEMRQRIRREARAGAVLKYHHILDVYDMGETDAGEPFLVMQLLSGETLAALLGRKRRLEPRLAALFGRDIAEALAVAHDKRFVHRDLKPANIFLHREPGEADPFVKVLDFGVAKDLTSSDSLRTAIGSVVGSLYYLSPEQARAEPDIDHRADIWALGVVLFEMLSGVRPFQGDTNEVFAGILNESIPTLSKVMRRVDPQLADVVARCMTRRREDRLQSAAEVAALLDPFAKARAAGAVSEAPPRDALSESAAAAAAQPPIAGLGGTVVMAPRQSAPQETELAAAAVRAVAPSTPDPREATKTTPIAMPMAPPIAMTNTSEGVAGDELSTLRADVDVVRTVEFPVAAGLVSPRDAGAVDGAPSPADPRLRRTGGFPWVVAVAAGLGLGLAGWVLLGHDEDVPLPAEERGARPAAGEAQPAERATAESVIPTAEAEIPAAPEGTASAAAQDTPTPATEPSAAPEVPLTTEAAEAVPPAPSKTAGPRRSRATAKPRSSAPPAPKPEPTLDRSEKYDPPGI